MNDTPNTNTVDRGLVIQALRLPEDTPHLTPGDVIHVEATLTVRTVINGLTYKDEPTVTITAAPTGTPEVVIRTGGTRAGVAVEGEQEVPADPPAALERATARLKAAGSWLWAAPKYAPRGYVLLLLVLVMVAPLTGCGIGYEKVGQPCSTIGAEGRTKQGAYLVCKPPAASDPTDTPRWRRA